jgi:hypothetical protein
MILYVELRGRMWGQLHEEKDDCLYCLFRVQKVVLIYPPYLSHMIVSNDRIGRSYRTVVSDNRTIDHTGVCDRQLSSDPYHIRIDRPWPTRVG